MDASHELDNISQAADAAREVTDTATVMTSREVVREAAKLIAPRNVYILPHADHNYESAKYYGNLIYIHRGFLDLKNPAQLQVLLTAAILHSHEEDYLLLAGPALACIIVALTWYHVNGKCKLLAYDSRDGGSYKLVTFTDLNIQHVVDLLNSTNPITER